MKMKYILMSLYMIYRISSLIIDNIEGSEKMFPVLNKEKTGKRLSELFQSHGISVKQVQEYLGLSCVQSVYHWLDGSSIPSVDNLYALSQLLAVPVDEMLCGNRDLALKYEMRKKVSGLKDFQSKIFCISSTGSDRSIVCDSGFLGDGKRQAQYERCLAYFTFFIKKNMDTAKRWAGNGCT